MKLFYKIFTPIMIIAAAVLTFAVMQMGEAYGSSDVYCSLSTRDGSVYCGTQNGLYVSEKGERMSGRPLPSLYRHPHASVYALAYDSLRSLLWVGAWDQIYCYDILGKHFINTDHLRIDMTVALRVLPDGSVQADTHRGRYIAQLSDSIAGGVCRQVNTTYYPKLIDDMHVSQQVSRYDNTPYYMVKALVVLLWLLALASLYAALRLVKRAEDEAADALAATPQEPAYAPPPLSTEDNTTFLTKLTQVVDANLSNPDFSIEQMAYEVALSRAQLFRKLKTAASTTPMAFLTERRMLRAAQLLEEPGASVQSVSEQVGFTDISNFRRAFMRQFKVSPKEYASGANSR